MLLIGWTSTSWQERRVRSQTERAGRSGQPHDDEFYQAAGGGGDMPGGRPRGGEDSVNESTVQQIKESDGEMLKSTTKLGLDSRFEHYEKQLDELKVTT